MQFRYKVIPNGTILSRINDKPPQLIPIGKTVDVSIKTPKDLGSVIRERRKKAKLTQKKTAALAGVGVRFLSELERGKPTAQIGKTLKVAQLLGLELRINERR